MQFFKHCTSWTNVHIQPWFFFNIAAEPGPVFLTAEKSDDWMAQCKTASRDRLWHW